MKLTVRVPATSANLGPGFDCMGVALQIYNTIQAEETGVGLDIQILDDTKEFLPRDGRNLVYRSMKAVFDITGYHPEGLAIVLNSEVPVTRGLGSSSASVVGGLLAANRFCGDRLEPHMLMRLAADIEGHPDNSTPAFTGGMAISILGAQLEHKSVKINNDKICFGVFIPEFILRTQKSRSVLPRMVSHKDAVFNAGHAAMVASAFMSEDYDLLRLALRDKLHQQYRRRLIPGMDKIFDAGRRFGGLGSYISGAGPTIVTILEATAKSEFEQQMNVFLNRSDMNKWSMKIVPADNTGAVITMD